MARKLVLDGNQKMGKRKWMCRCIHYSVQTWSAGGKRLSGAQAPNYTQKTSSPALARKTLYHATFIKHETTAYSVMVVKATVEYMSTNTCFDCERDNPGWKVTGFSSSKAHTRNLSVLKASHLSLQKGYSLAATSSKPSSWSHQDRHQLGQQKEAYDALEGCERIRYHRNSLSQQRCVRRYVNDVKLRDRESRLLKDGDVISFGGASSLHYRNHYQGFYPNPYIFKSVASLLYTFSV